MKKILIVSYYWPPAGGTGVYRILKFTRYLSRMGHDIVVLTTRESFSHMNDRQLLNEVPENVKVYRSAILEPTTFIKSSLKESGAKVSTDVFQKKAKGWKARIIKWIRLNVFVPDAKIGWYPFAVSLGKKIIESEQPDIILSTSPPPTAALVARKLASHSGLPWIADFRDPWTQIFYYDTARRTPFADLLNKRLERLVLRDCSHITAVNSGFFPHLNVDHKTTVIPNGYDLEELGPGMMGDDENDDGFFTIRYMGTMRINDFVPKFFDALNDLYVSHGEFKHKLRVEFFGSTAEEITNYYRKLPVSEAIHQGPYVGRDEAVRLLRTADLQLLIIGKSQMQHVIFTTKLFEYLCTGKPILGLGPVDGSAGKVLAETNSGKMIPHENERAIRDFMMEAFTCWQKGTPMLQPDEEAVKRYDFRNLTKTLSDLIQQDWSKA
ncbi:MAG: glycosyltransferase [Salibacteraceae bacterium]